MSLIKGIHHIALKCRDQEEYDKSLKFYGEVLGLELARSWDGGAMFHTGAGIMEIFNSGEVQLPQGVIRHFALATDDVDACVEAVKKAGYEVFMEPKNISIPSEPPLPARIAFCYGPMGEEIEFFCEL